MQDLDTSADTIRFAGVQHIERAPEGVIMRRLPAWTQSQIADPAMQLLVGVPSGARLEFDSDAAAIELEVGLTLLRVGDSPTLPAAFDLVVDGTVVAGKASVEGTVIAVDPRTGAVSFHPGPPTTTVRFDGLGAGTKHVEVWLPHAASVVLHALRIDDAASASAPPPDPRRRWVHYGSSISHCLEAERPTGVWPVVAARRAGVALDSLAFAGQCHLDPFVARTIRDLRADLISLKVGINIVNGDSMRERTFGAAVHGFLDTIRDGHPATPVLLITPILCPAVENAPGPTFTGQSGLSAVARPPALALGALTLGRIRELLTDVVVSRRSSGDEHLHLLDGRDLFGADDLADLPDGLHPNAAGYLRMGERFHDLAFAAGAPFARAVYAG